MTSENRRDNRMDKIMTKDANSREPLSMSASCEGVETWTFDALTNPEAKRRELRAREGYLASAVRATTPSKISSRKTRAGVWSFISDNLQDEYAHIYLLPEFLGYRTIRFVREAGDTLSLEYQGPGEGVSPVVIARAIKNVIESVIDNVKRMATVICFPSGERALLEVA